MDFMSGERELGDRGRAARAGADDGHAHVQRITSNRSVFA
jgi:hypothetical protein